jgi:catechol 2,3-dioxygenase-like lactoylglutathione lyase family enzyme
MSDMLRTAVSKSRLGNRSLHWVLKVGNLKDSLDFYENVLGLRILRHEEFQTGTSMTPIFMQLMRWLCLLYAIDI